MKKLLVMLFLIGALCMVGCQKPSMNVQRALLRSSGDTGGTFLIENVNDWQKAKQDVDTWSTAVLNLLKTGQVDKMTAIKLSAELKKIIPNKHWGIVDMAIMSLDLVKIRPTAMIGVKNAKRIEAFFIGMKNSSVYFEQP